MLLNIQNRLSKRFKLFVLFLLYAVLLSGCLRDAPEPTATPAITATADLLATPTDLLMPDVVRTESPYPWTDETSIMQGLCFESIYDAAGQVFIFRVPEALTNLYDLADSSGLCSHPITRGTFDFSEGRILAGTWSRGRGCSAHHEITDIRQDDVAMIYAISVRLVTEGTCNYELVRPFWIGIHGKADYDVRLLIGA